MAPTPFVVVDDAGKFSVDPRALEILRGIKGPVAVVAVAGLYRTGKSYLLNQLLGDEPSGGGEGFNVGGTVNACTKGIWIWGTPKVLEDGVSVIFLDTEGLGSTSRSQTHDCRVFSLALLLCSYFIYNSRGVIDGNAIDELSLVINLTKNIHVQSGNDKGEDNGSDFHAFFPTFLWVVRDFALKLNENGREITSRQYLENALKPQANPGFNEETTSKNHIRMLLTNFFRDRDCATLVRPVTDEETLRDLSSQPMETLRPEFVDGLRQIRSRLYTALGPKTLYGKALNGAMLATLAETYVDALNSGGVPVISTAWDRLVQMQTREAMQKGFDVYKDQMGAKVQRMESTAGGTTEAVNRPTTEACDAVRDTTDALVMPLEEEVLHQIHLECEAAAYKVLEQDGMSQDDVPDSSGTEVSKGKEQLRGLMEEQYTLIKVS
jgi:hypothetical protein